MCAIRSGHRSGHRLAQDVFMVVIAPRTILPLLLLLASLPACTGTILNEEEEEKLIVAHEVRWAIPPEVVAIGDGQHVPYTGAGAWTGSSSCQGGMTTGASELSDFLETNFQQVSQVGGYSCRSIVGNSSRMSVHGTGRALDIHIPLRNGHADSEAGDPIGNWLIENAESIGIQYIIWNRTQWTAERSPGAKTRRYNGSHPHNDHLHVELSADAGQASTPWFSGPRDTPQTPSCETIATSGATLETSSLCLHLFGPSQYWRNESGAGHEGDLLWTNAFTSSAPSNWAKWELALEEGGQYKVEVFLDPTHGQYHATPYRLQHAGVSSSIELDQGRASGWTSLGVFDFSSGGNQSLSLYDNTSEVAPAQRSIMLDAIRVTRQ